MSHVRRVPMLAAFVLIGSGCEAPVGRPTVAVGVSVLLTSVDAQVSQTGSITWVAFALSVRFENLGETQVIFVPCASFLESLSGSGWRAAWRPICLAVDGSSLHHIPPGDKRTVEIQVTAALAGPGGPKWEGAGLDERLRYRAGYSFPGATGGMQTVPSNEFRINASSQ